jgi:branched-subunit amino acid transport protein
MNSAWLVIAATAAGVLLPKVLPGLLLPDRVPAPIAAWLVYVPAGMLGAFTAITAAGYVGPFPRALPVVGALALAGLVALLSRRTFPSLLVGWAALAVLHLGGLL